MKRAADGIINIEDTSIKTKLYYYYLDGYEIGGYGASMHIRFVLDEIPDNKQFAMFDMFASKILQKDLDKKILNWLSDSNNLSQLLENSGVMYDRTETFDFNITWEIYRDDIGIIGNPKQIKFIGQIADDEISFYKTIKQ